VRGGFVIGAYGLLIFVHFLANFVDLRGAHWWLTFPGIPLAIMASVYTAYLFAQARARDLWQNPLLPPHLLVQALMAGSGAMFLLASVLERNAVSPLGWLFALSSVAHLLMVLGESTLTHGTAHGHLASREMTRGRFGGFYWLSLGLVALGVLTPAWGALGVVPGLIGLLAFEHAYVQAGQAVPLA
jgi:formate-dependent nitrite reductase membrane component NrfD